MKKLKKPLILIVDDTPQNIQLLCSILYDKGYGISISTSGIHALESVKNRTPDLILLDIQMPEMDGYEVCRLLKANHETKDIPVIFLTAKTETKDLLFGFELGAVDYVTKPFNAPELSARVSTHIELNAAKEKAKALNEKLLSSNHKLKIAYNDIQDSIHAAKTIQDSMLPDLKLLCPEGIKHFALYSPKNIVGGDFYWAGYNDGYFFIAVADCTGYGIPGALLSMLGHNNLSDIVNSEKICDPAEILNRLNLRINKILHQKLTSSHDGMDIALCVINTRTNTMEYAGGKRPIIYFRDNQLIELLPDKFSIGGPENNHSLFSKQTIQLRSNDTFFLFTDGITDQYDSTDRKKLTKKRFIQQLSILKEKTTIKKDLQDYLKLWQGNNIQTDDILVVGLKVS